MPDPHKQTIHCLDIELTREEILESVNQSFLDGSGTLLSESHFENGRSLHSDQYYFAKQYFQNSRNIEKLAKLLICELQRLGVPPETTLVGYRDYTALLLARVCDIVKTYNYAILEHSSEDSQEFVWQQLPSFQQRILAILPITCTCSTYIRIRKFLKRAYKATTEGKNAMNEEVDRKVSRDFVNVFVILDKKLELRKNDSIEIDELAQDENTTALYEIYSAAKWINISPTEILIAENSEQHFHGHSMLRLYSRLHRPDDCEKCYPADPLAERPLFPTHDNYETPDLIFGFPNIGKAEGQNDLFSVLGSPIQDWGCHLHGHIKVNNSSYQDYIRGNVVYEKNKSAILAHFKPLLLKRTEGYQKILFITAETKHNSGFLEDLAISVEFRDIPITILRFQPFNEFIDNFMALSGHLFEEKGGEATESAGKEKVFVAYFEEVLSAGRTFKLVSNYLKHTRKKWDGGFVRRGFDLLFTLVDRTSRLTKDEMLKKLDHGNDENLEDRFLAYFRLNVPLVLARHHQDPLQQRMVELNGMLTETNLDFLRQVLIDELGKAAPTPLPEIETAKVKHERLGFFPFAAVEKAPLDPVIHRIFTTYWPYFDQERFNLLKLFLAHEVNSELAQLEEQGLTDWGSGNRARSGFLNDLVDRIIERNEAELSKFFVLPGVDHRTRVRDIEKEIVQDAVLKLLTKRPFLYYRELYDRVFSFCVKELDKHCKTLDQVGHVNTFRDFRRLKFLMRRSVDVNSNYLLSRRFLEFMRRRYHGISIDGIVRWHEELDKPIPPRVKPDPHWHDPPISGIALEVGRDNVNYQKRQVSHFLGFLLLCYKELLHAAPARSIVLERLLNNPRLLPTPFTNGDDSVQELEQMLRDPYFQFTGMLKAENIQLLRDLKDLHKHNLRRGVVKKERHGTRLLRYYLNPGKKNNPIIWNAQRFLACSRHERNPKERAKVRTAVLNMLTTVSLLHGKSTTSLAAGGTKREFDTEFREILDRLVAIMHPNRSDIKYAFFIKYRERQEDDAAAEHLYGIASDAETDHELELRSHGLVSELLDGLHASAEVDSEQSILTAIKDNDRVFGFHNVYYKKVGEQAIGPFNLEDMFRADLYDHGSKRGLKILSSGRMSVYIRFCSVHTDTDDVQHLVPKAVLVLCTSEQAGVKSFIEFMSNERLRLLLLAKEEVLDYLQKHASGSAFYDVLENRKRKVLRNYVKHGLQEYFLALRGLVKEIRVGGYNEDKEKLHGILTKAVQGHLDFRLDGDDSTRPITLTTYQLREHIRLLFETDMIGTRWIALQNVAMEGFEEGQMELPSGVLDIVLPELITNMKKYAPDIGDLGLAIRLDRTMGTMHFSNYIHAEHGREPRLGSEGITMCKKVVLACGLPPLLALEHESTFLVTLILRSNGKGPDHR